MNLKELIRGRWIVEGYYCFDYLTSSWEYHSEYQKGMVIWEFTKFTLKCTKDGEIFFDVPCAVIHVDILAIDFTKLLPFYNRYIETHRIVLRGDTLWLYDRGTRTHAGTFWLALKLTRE